MEQFIIFIIVAVVGLLFNRSKINNQKQQSEQPRPVQTRPMQMEEAREESSPFAEATEARTLKDAADQLKTQPDLYKQQEEMAAKLNDLNREEELHRKKLEVINTEVYDEEVQLDFDLKQKDIVNGIIMSEVLGPPRARKPYNRRRT